MALYGNPDNQFTEQIGGSGVHLDASAITSDRSAEELGRSGSAGQDVRGGHRDDVNDAITAAGLTGLPTRNCGLGEEAAARGALTCPS